MARQDEPFLHQNRTQIRSAERRADDMAADIKRSLRYMVRHKESSYKYEQAVDELTRIKATRMHLMAAEKTHVR
jgi:hypothetical protein